MAQVSSSAQFTPSQQSGGAGPARAPAQCQGAAGQGQGQGGQQGKGAPMDSIRNSELYELARYEESEKQRSGGPRAPPRAAPQQQQRQQSSGYSQMQACTDLHYGKYWYIMESIGIDLLPILYCNYKIINLFLKA